MLCDSLILGSGGWGGAQRRPGLACSGALLRSAPANPIDGGAANLPGRPTGVRKSAVMHRFLGNIDRAAVNNS